jgi:hypothetical protein
VETRNESCVVSTDVVSGSESSTKNAKLRHALPCMLRSRALLLENIALRDSEERHTVGTLIAVNLQHVPHM